MNKQDKILKNVPDYFKPTLNPVWKAILEANGIEDEKVVDQIIEAGKQIFVKTAEQKYLDSLGNNVAVFRPLEVNLSDSKFRVLIPYLSFYAKQVKQLISDVLDIFYSEIFSRYNVDTATSTPFSLFGGESLVFRKEGEETKTVTRRLLANGGADGFGTIRLETTAGMYIGQRVTVSDDDTFAIPGTIVNLTNNIATLDINTSAFTIAKNAVTIFQTYQYILFKSTDFAIPGAATCQEIVSAINLISNGVTASTTSSDTKANLRTDTVGLKGYMQVMGGTANDVLQFSTIAAKRLRIQISEINPNEIIIKIPSTIPALRRALKGSCHFHINSLLVPPYISSYLYNPTIVDYSVRKITTTLNQSVAKGQVYTQILVSDASNFPNEPGYLMVNFGLQGMEYPIRYIGRPNNVTLLLDPSYVFTNDHQAGDTLNLMVYESTVPRTNGDDYAVYNVGVDAAREQVQEIIRSIVATGVTIRWEVDYPTCGKS